MPTSVVTWAGVGIAFWAGIDIAPLLDGAPDKGTSVGAASCLVFGVFVLGVFVFGVFVWGASVFTIGVMGIAAPLVVPFCPKVVVVGAASISAVAKRLTVGCS